MTWPTEQAREAVEDAAYDFLPTTAYPAFADAVLAALAPHVAALVRAERAEALREAILADPGPLLDALPDDVLVEALVRRGVLVTTTEAQAAVPDLHFWRYDPDPLDCDHGATYTGPAITTHGDQVVSEPFTTTYCYVCHHLAPTPQEDAP